MSDEFVLDGDVIAPRTMRERYRVYTRSPAGELRLLATAGDAQAVGVALITLGNEGEFDDLHPGILDSHGDASKPGTWLIKPWQAPEVPTVWPEVED